MGCGSSRETPVQTFTPQQENIPQKTTKKNSKVSPINSGNKENLTPKNDNQRVKSPVERPTTESITNHAEEEVPFAPESYIESDKETEREKEQDKNSSISEQVEVEDKTAVNEDNQIEKLEKTFFNECKEYDRDLCQISSATVLSTPPNKLTIIHFNDVYNIEPRDKEPVGGAARFATKIHSFEDDPLVLFSGDCLNPSLMSSVTRGKQMIPIMNAIGVHTAVYGNHDFDFGVDDLIDFKNKTTFPWLLSNVQDKLTQTLLADGIKKVVCNWHGRKEFTAIQIFDGEPSNIPPYYYCRSAKILRLNPVADPGFSQTFGRSIGIIGLVEKEWLVTLSTIDPDDVNYVDFIECAKDLVDELRNEQGCTFIIALTHMRVPNDLKLLKSDLQIDLVLGGHDHHYETQQYNGKQFVKSGTDFREFTEITVDFSDGSPQISTQRHEITSDIIEHEKIKAECDKYSVILGEKMEEVLGTMQVELDGRFSTVRTKESNLGNFICDIMRAAAQADVAILNSGSLRSDQIHPAGPFKKKDLVSILPMVDSLIVIKVKGSTLIEALENSVSQYPKYEGRFLQVSGVTFVFDPEKAEGERILKDTVMVHDNIPIVLDQEYTVVTKEYVARGKDGYDMLTSCEVLVDGEDGPVLLSCIENHFESIKIYKGRRTSASGHRQSIVVKHDEVQPFMEQQRSKLAPKVEGRIRQVGDPPVLTPNLISRRSKLRLRTPTLQEEDLETIENQENDTPSQINEPNFEEVETQDDSDIDHVMESDEGREQISEDDRMNLWEACRIDDLEKVKEIVNNRLMDYKFWIMEKTLLHHTTQHNALKCLEYLVKETNLDVDVRDQILKGTALFYAAEHGSNEAALFLIDNGASVNAKNSLWETPLHVACENHQGPLIITLLNRGADRTAKDKNDEKPKI